ncbi:MAG: FHA domain-containing protein [Candidatus Eremiobacteraeota bacterium]|nr:FHA domain-containing protein [Candidatus Eremiobacteraeota bacterium]
MSGFEFTGDPTENTEVGELTLSHAHWELHIVQEGLREFRIPFYRDTLVLQKHAGEAFPEGVPWSATLTQHGVELSNRESGQKLALAVGESVKIENRRVWLVDVRQPPKGSLEGVSPEVAGRVWHIKNQLAWVGRQGKRMNHLEFDHPTISRTQATLSVDPSGRISLLAEATGSPTTVNGEVVEAGRTQELFQGDLVGFGKLQFRFSGSTETALQESALFIKTLGSFRVNLGSETGPEVLIDTEKARWLLAYLATCWTSALPIEPLLESFWPDVDRTKCRKNLSYTLRQLRESFKEAGVELDDYLLRNPSEYRLKPDRLGEHDYVELLNLVSSGKALTSASALQRAIKLHQGSFLPTCYENWAEELRQDLESALTQTLLASGLYFLEQGEFPAAVAAADHLTGLDPLSEEAALLRMNASLGKAEPQEAVEFYEKFEIRLKNEGLEPSVELLKCYHRARLGI